MLFYSRPSCSLLCEGPTPVNTTYASLCWREKNHYHHQVVIFSESQCHIVCQHCQRASHDCNSELHLFGIWLLIPSLRFPFWVMPNFDFPIRGCRQKANFCWVIWYRIYYRLMSFLQGMYYLCFNQIPETNPSIFRATDHLSVTATQTAIHFVVFVDMTGEPG